MDYTHYSTQGHVFTLERDRYAAPRHRWTAVDGYFGRYATTGSGPRPRIVATASSEAALRRECREIAEWRNRRRDLHERMARQP